MKNPIIYLFLTGWRFADKRRHLILVYLAMFAIAQAVSLAQPLVIGRLLNAVQTSATGGASPGLMQEIFLCLGLYFLTEVGFWAFHGPGRLIERFVAFRMKASYKGELFKIVTEQQLQWHREHHSGDSIDKINRASNALASFFDTTFEISYMVFRLIGAELILLFFMPAAGAVVLATTLVCIGIIVAFDNALYERYEKLNKFENSVAAALHDYVTNIISVITLRLQGRVRHEVDRRMMVSLPVYENANVLNETKWCLTTVIIATMTCAVLGWYVWNALSSGQALMSGTFFTLFEYLRRIGDSFYNFAFIYGTVVRQAADLRGAESLLQAGCDARAEHANTALPPNWKQIDVRGLNFVYSDEQHRTHHLDDVSITLERGKSIALVGESGSGKSTLLNLLRGMQQTDQVELLCDGKIMPRKLAHLSGVTTLIPQDPELFADTVTFNVTFGLEAKEEDINHAICLSRFAPVVPRLSSGLETNIAEKGVNMSGGEKQRLALARGLFFARESDIVLMDEPTSSVDSQNERAIYSAVLQEFKDKCVISSVHKLHLLDMFDLIYVFDDGRLVEKGSLGELLSKDSMLAGLWTNYDTEFAVVPVERGVCEPVST